MTNGFTGVFGGSPVQPSQVGYQAIVLTADITLLWPSQVVDTSAVVARWNSITVNASSLTITLGDATAISTGQDAVFCNLGSTTFTLLANDGSTITAVLSGQCVYIICTDDSTPAGSWLVTVLASTTTTANANSLAGAGLIAITTTLNQNFTFNPQVADYSLLTGDRAAIILWGGGSGTLTLPDPAVVGAGWFAGAQNQGSGTLTLSPAAGLIDGASTLVMNIQDSTFFYTDGANCYTIGIGRSIASTFTRLVKNVAGSSDVALSAAESANQVIQFNGLLTGDINVTVGNNVAEYFVFNNTTGAFTLTFKTTAGSGVVLTQTSRRICNCDGTNVVYSDDSGGGTVTEVDTGTGLSGGPITSTGTVSLANTTVTPGSYTSADITVDAQGRITAAADGAGGGGGSGTVTSITAGTGLSGGTITTAGTIAIANSGVTAGSYTNASITVNAQGQLTAASNGGTGTVPTGSVMDFAGSAAPTGWLLCYGQSVATATYAALFGVIGYTYGGSGANFTIPDLRGRAIFGQDNMGGSAANRVTNAISGITGTVLGATGGNQSLQGHTHTISWTASSNSPFSTAPGGTDVSGGAHTQTSSSTGAGSSQNMPPTMILNKIIKT